MAVSDQEGATVINASLASLTQIHFLHAQSKTKLVGLLFFLNMLRDTCQMQVAGSRVWGLDQGRAGPQMQSHPADLAGRHGQLERGSFFPRRPSNDSIPAASQKGRGQGTPGAQGESGGGLLSA